MAANWFITTSSTRTRFFSKKRLTIKWISSNIANSGFGTIPLGLLVHMLLLYFCSWWVVTVLYLLLGIHLWTYLSVPYLWVFSRTVESKSDTNAKKVRFWLCWALEAAERNVGCLRKGQMIVLWFQIVALHCRATQRAGGATAYGLNQSSILFSDLMHATFLNYLNVVNRVPGGSWSLKMLKIYCVHVSPISTENF